LKRANKPGFSIVVPSVDERLNTDDLRRGIVRSFFWPILLGELEVELESPEKSWRINTETLAIHRDLLPPTEAAVIEFASWASFAKPAEFVNLSEQAAVKPQWSQISDQLLPEAKLDEIRSRLEKDQRVAIKIPVRVRPKSNGSQEEMSCFTIYLATCRDSGHRPIFLRDGIVITDVRSPLMSGTRSLVVTDDPPLAGLLGDAGSAMPRASTTHNGKKIRQSSTDVTFMAQKQSSLSPAAFLKSSSGCTRQKQRATLTCCSIFSSCQRMKVRPNPRKNQNRANRMFRRYRHLRYLRRSKSVLC
jgi:hypothetical protein